MTISRAELVQLLREVPDVAVLVENEEAALLAVKPRDDDPVAVGLGINSGEMVELRTMELLTASAEWYRPTLLRALADMNYRYKLARFALNHDDGQVLVRVTLPVMDGTLTVKQVARTVNVFRSVAPACRRRCMVIRETGKDTSEPLAEFDRTVAEALRLAAASAARGSSNEAAKPSKPGAKKTEFGMWLDDQTDR